MRIGYVVPEFPSQTHAFFWREVSALRQEGHVVHVFSTTRPPQDACRHEFAQQARAETTYLAPPRGHHVLKALVGARVDGLRAAVRHVAACRFDSPRDAFRLAAIALCAADLASHAQRLGLEHIHIHSCADAAHLGAVGRLLGGPPYSLTLHGDLTVYGRDHARKMADALFVSVVTRPLQLQVMQETGRSAAQVPVIWMGVDTARFAPGPPRAQDEDPTSPLRLLTIARLNRTKGHLFALRALRRVIDEGEAVHYVIAGAGPQEDAIREEVRALGLDEVVDLIGTVSEGAVLRLLHSSDVFVLPSFGLGEAAPVSVMEAMACGLSVISSVIGGTPDMMTDGVHGLLVEQQDVDALASSIVSLAHDPELRRRLGEHARERALDAFDYRTNARKLVGEMQP